MAPQSSDMVAILAHALNAILYAALGTVLARGLWRTEPISVTEFGWVRHALLAPVLLQLWLLHQSMFGSGHMTLGVGTALSCIVWLSVVIYWLGSFFHRLEGLQALVVPVAAVASLMPLLLPASRPLAHADVPFFSLHLVLSMVAYSLFTIASLHVLLMALLKRRLHSGALPPLVRSLPPLLTLERLLFRILAAGFVILTASLVTGMFFSEALTGHALQFNHKTLFGVLSWLIFGLLLSGRVLWGWRGRTALRWTLAGFVALVLAYVGTKFVVEVLLGR
jgi:ABC-type uncharacterized transport system permease subunit